MTTFWKPFVENISDPIYKTLLRNCHKGIYQSLFLYDYFLETFCREHLIECSPLFIHKNLLRNCHKGIFG